MAGSQCEITYKCRFFKIKFLTGCHLLIYEAFWLSFLNGGSNKSKAKSIRYLTLCCIQFYNSVSCSQSKYTQAKYEMAKKCKPAVTCTEWKMKAIKRNLSLSFNRSNCNAAQTQVCFSAQHPNDLPAGTLFMPWSPPLVKVQRFLAHAVIFSSKWIIGFRQTVFLEKLSVQ